MIRYGLLYTGNIYNNTIVAFVQDYFYILVKWILPMFQPSSEKLKRLIFLQSELSPKLGH